MEPEPTEWEVRKLRDQVLCDVISDVGWEQIKQNWLRKDSISWLREKAKRPLSIPPPLPK